MLFILSGCSGAGKNTLINKMLERNENYELMATFTTRDMREGESEGHPYHFVSKQEFEERIAAGEFYEYEEVHGNYYGTSRRLLMEKNSSGKVLLKDIDVKGTVNLVKIASKDVDIVTFFIGVTSKDVLEERLLERGEKQIDLRLSRYDLEISYMNEYDYIIENKELMESTLWIESLIEAELQGEVYAKDDQIRISDDSEDVREAEEALKAGKIPEAETVKIAMENGKWTVVSGWDYYKASQNTGLRVPKYVVRL